MAMRFSLLEVQVAGPLQFNALLNQRVLQRRQLTAVMEHATRRRVLREAKSGH